MISHLDIVITSFRARSAFLHGQRIEFFHQLISGDGFDIHHATGDAMPKKFDDYGI